MNKPGVHRATANSRRGRSMIRIGQPHHPWAIPKDIQDWNKQVEERKLAKKLARKEQK